MQAVYPEIPSGMADELVAVFVERRQTVAVPFVEGRPLLQDALGRTGRFSAGELSGVRHRGERRRADQLHAVYRSAAVKIKTHVPRHVLRRREYRSGRIDKIHGRRWDERGRERWRPIVIPELITECGAGNEFRCEDRRARTHSDSIEHAGLHRIGPKAAVELRENRTGRREAVVRVRPTFSRRKERTRLAQRYDIVHITGLVGVVVGDARRVRENFPHENRPVAAIDREPGEVMCHRGIEIETACVVELQERKGGHRLGDRSDCKARLRRNRRVRRDVGVAKRDNA